MTSPSGRAARAASLLGDDYQHLLAWSEAVHALRPSSDARAFRVESIDAGSYDDVSVLRRTGPHMHLQAKFSVDPARGFGLDWLVKPVGTGKQPKSLAQRALDTHRELSPAGGLTLRLVTNKTPGPDDAWLAAYAGHDGRLGHEARRLADGHVKDPTAKTAADGLDRLRGHLGCDQDEFLRLLDDWQLRWAADDSYVRDIARARMIALGLRDDDDALRQGSGYVRSLVTAGRRSVELDQLRTDVDALGLRLRSAARVLSVSILAPDPHASDADEHVDLRPAPGDPEPTEPDVAQALTAAVGRLRTAGGTGPVEVRASVRLPAWFLLGTLMKHVEDWHLTTAFAGRTWASDDPDGEGPALTARPEPGSTRNGGHRTGELHVGVSITADVREDVERHLARRPGRPADRLWLALDRPDRHAVKSPAHAAALVDQTRAAITDQLRQGGHSQVHLYIAAPRMVPLFLGHRWNRLPEAIVYQDLGPADGYRPAYTVR